MSDMDVVMEEPAERRGDGGEGEEERDSIQPVALLMDELKNEDISIRVESMKRLQTIALALGPERTRNELLPFLQCSLDEEDEVLVALANEISGLVEHSGGASFVYTLVPLLEGLVSTEEPYVRTIALAAFRNVIAIMSVSSLIEHLLPSIKRLAGGDWFSKKCSAASLIYFCVEHLASAKEEEEKKEEKTTDLDKNAIHNSLEELLKLFELLAMEETPLVRKAVANNLSLLASTAVNVQICINTLVPICNQLASDPQDSVRLLAVEPLAMLLKRCLGIDPESFRTKLIPLFFALASDSSWRIRFMVATHYTKLSTTLNDQPSSGVDTLGIYCALLRDQESEVRAAACTELAMVSEFFTSKQVEEHIIPSARVLLTDPSSHVRASLGLQLNDLARVLGAEIAMNAVLPMILQLLRDDASDVRLNVISKLDVIVDVIGIEQLSASLLPAIIALAEDRQWRVRQTIMEYIPELSAHLGKEFFQEKILPLLISWLEDSVYAVRETAINALQRVVKQFGGDWAEAALIPQLLPLSKHRNYLRRVTFLHALSSTCLVVSNTSLDKQYLPILEEMAADPIANVRFSAINTFRTIIPIIIADPSIASKDIIKKLIVPILQQLQRDTDTDVHECATLALNLIPTF